MRDSSFLLRRLLTIALLCGLALKTLGAPFGASEAFAAGLGKSAGADLGVTILRSGDDPRLILAPGQTFAVSVGVNNLRGGADAHDAVLTVVLPDSVKLAGAPTPPARIERQSTGQSLTWTLGTVTSGAFARLFEIDLAVGDTVAAGADFTVSARVATSDPDANAANDANDLTFHVQAAAAALAMRSTLAGVPFTASAPVKFAVEVTNLGTVPATASTLTLTLPEGVSLGSSEPAASVNGRTLAWQLGDIGPGASQTIEAAIALGARMEGDSLLFVFDAATTAAADAARHHLEITRRVQLADASLKIWLDIEGADEPGTLPVGKDVRYVVRYGNFGTQAASARVSLSLDGGLAFLDAAPPPISSDHSDRFEGGVYSWDAGDVTVGAWQTIKARIHVASVPAQGSLAMAAITPDGNRLAGSSAIAHLYAARSLARPSQGHFLRNLLIATALLILAAVSLAWRMRRRKPS